MIKVLKLLVSLCSVCVILSCSSDTTTTTQPTDHHEELLIKISRLTAQNPNQALAIIDSAQNSNQIPDYQADFLRAIVFTQDDAKIDSARTLLEELLEHDTIQNNVQLRMNVLAQLVSLNRIRKNNERVLYWATQLLQLSRNEGYEVGTLATQVEIGLALTGLGHIEEGLRNIDEAISQLDEIRKFEQLDACLLAMKRKIRVMNEQHNYQASIALAERIILKVSDFKDHPQEYNDHSPHFPNNAEERKAYCDSHIAHAYAFLAYAYASIGTEKDQLVRVKNMEMATKYAHLFEQMEYGKTCNGRKLISSTWFKMGEYKKMEDTYAELREKWQDDTMQTSYATMLNHMAQAAYFKGKYEESFDYWKRYSDITQELNTNAMRTAAQEYAARYHEQEQKHLIHKANDELAKKNIIIYVILLLAILTTATSFYFFQMRRRIGDKNRALVKIINELQDVKEVKEAQKTTTTKVTQDEETQVTTPVKENEHANDLFLKIDEYIRSERLYRDPNLQRQDVLDHFSINKNTLSALFSEHNDGLSFPAYINNIRLEEGQHMLRHHPEMTITDIANAIGFSAPNFREQFKKKFGITPTEFRQNL